MHLFQTQINQSLTAPHTTTQTEISYQTEPIHISSFQSGRFASSQPCKERGQTRVEYQNHKFRTPTGPADLKIPISRLAAADGHSGQDGTPSLVAAPPDPPSGFRWQAACHYVVCFSVPGAQTQRSETRCPVARVLFMYGYRFNTAQTTRNRKPNMSRTHQMRRL